MVEAVTARNLLSNIATNVNSWLVNSSFENRNLMLCNYQIECDKKWHVVLRSVKVFAYSDIIQITIARCSTPRSRMVTHDTLSREAVYAVVREEGFGAW